MELCLKRKLNFESYVRNNPVRFFILIAVLLNYLSPSLYAAVDPNESEIKYRTSFGNCPSRTAGTLTLKLVKAFEDDFSLSDVKDKIISEKLKEKHFISSYQIKFDPLKKLLKFNFECPKPLMKVQVYKDNGLDSYEAILVEDGDLYDPTYEVLLRGEKKLKRELPHLALPIDKIQSPLRISITKLIGNLKPRFRKKISELIIDEKNEMTIILSIRGRPSSIFLGNKAWDEKMVKLQKIVRYMEKKKKIPAVINLTNPEKVVVKFSDKF